MQNDFDSLVQDIQATIKTGAPVQTRLSTNERVLARITDGIYRQPASALRELISNAYDADAREVVILTDAPRFNSISIRDDGKGLSTEVVVNLVKSIGGSAKRTELGKELGIASSDLTHSMGGRQLIGRLGIGLFSVAQFTRHFLIITKQAGDNFRTIADITLGHEGSASSDVKAQKTKDISTGHAKIHQELATDIDSHGTEITLLDLLPRTKDELSTADLWGRIDRARAEADTSGPEEPRFHIGRMESRKSDLLKTPPQLPWNTTDTPDEKFKKLVEQVRALASSDRDLVDLDIVCDKYLQTLWTLACSIPVNYLDGHPFDMTAEDNVLYFKLDNGNGQAERVHLRADETLRDSIGLKTPLLKKGDSFRVEIDGVRLSRPILFRNLPKTASAIKTPMLFVGKENQEFNGRPSELSGGPLRFEAYLFWAPKILPKQHQGVVLRVGNASGSGFDRTFLGYQVSEQNRLRQITAEIFVHQGLDEALNLDRESFNYAHPHYQYLVKWLHSAIRQLTNKNKEVGKELRSIRLQESSAKHREAIEQRVLELLRARGTEDPVQVALLDTAEMSMAEKQRNEGALVFDRAKILPNLPGKKTDKKNERSITIEKQATAVAQILHSWGALDELSFDEQAQLIKEILVVSLFTDNS